VGQLLAVTNASGANLREYIYMVSTLVGYINAGVLVYVHNDHLNTPQVITAQNQSVLWMADYEPFGKVKLNSNNTISFGARFPGQYLDSETGNYYNYFRDYDPSIGRYLQSDPIGLEGGVNTYAYVEGSPISFVDPLGLRASPGFSPPARSTTSRRSGLYRDTPLLRTDPLPQPYLLPLAEWDPYDDNHDLENMILDTPVNSGTEYCEENKRLLDIMKAALQRQMTGRDNGRKRQGRGTSNQFQELMHKGRIKSIENYIKALMAALEKCEDDCKEK
jgi:RHS repeat-associated protein